MIWWKGPPVARPGVTAIEYMTTVEADQRNPLGAISEPLVFPFGYAIFEAIHPEGPGGALRPISAPWKVKEPVNLRREGFPDLAFEYGFSTPEGATPAFAYAQYWEFNETSAAAFVGHRNGYGDIPDATQNNVYAMAAVLAEAEEDILVYLPAAYYSDFAIYDPARDDFEVLPVTWNIYSLNYLSPGGADADPEEICPPAPPYPYEPPVVSVSAPDASVVRYRTHDRPLRD